MTTCRQHPVVVLWEGSEASANPREAARGQSSDDISQYPSRWVRLQPFHGVSRATLARRQGSWPGAPWPTSSRQTLDQPITRDRAHSHWLVWICAIL